MSTLTPAVYYMRTSSSTNLGGDSEVRQITAIEDFAKDKYSLIKGAYDEAVKGSDSIHDREGFRALLEFLSKTEDCKTIIVSDISRFSRDLITQELGFRDLKQLGYNLIPADSPEHFIEDNPSSKLIRTLLGAVSEWEKNSIVQKLLNARQRARLKSGKTTVDGRPKCEGRKSLKEMYGEIRFNKFIRKVVTLRHSGLSYHKIAGEISKKGYVQPSSGRPFDAGQVRRFLRSEGYVEDDAINDNCKTEVTNVKSV